MSTRISKYDAWERLMVRLIAHHRDDVTVHCAQANQFIKRKEERMTRKKRQYVKREAQEVNSYASVIADLQARKVKLEAAIESLLSLKQATQ